MARGESERATATLDTDAQTLAALLYRGRPLDDVLRSGEATIGGETAVVARFLQLLSLPEPANTI